MMYCIMRDKTAAFVANKGCNWVGVMVRVRLGLTTTGAALQLGKERGVRVGVQVVSAMETGGAHRANEAQGL